MPKKLLIVDVAALGYDLLRACGATEIGGLTFRPTETVFPAVTCTVQASFRTGSAPAWNGMIANGLYARNLRKVMFWEQSCRLISGERIWREFRKRGGKVGLLFWQQSMGEEADVLLSPAPVHKHHGGMIEDCYGRPEDLYDRLAGAVGGRFKLRHYWGPLASWRAGDWISQATIALLRDPALAPDLCLTYLPTLDYDLQRFGPNDQRCGASIAAATRQITFLVHAAREQGFEVVVFGDYAIVPTPGGPVYPNRALLDAGLLKTRSVKDRLYPDFFTSRAFAMVDHEVAHVYVHDPADVEPTRQVLSQLPGVGEVMVRQAQTKANLDHPNVGELVLIAADGMWFAYPWWSARDEAPEYASHVDIHNKPGYDPCELLSGWPPLISVSQDATKIRGSHGRAGKDRPVAWASTLDLGEISSILDLAAKVKAWLEK